jgi:hypothetical protein
MRAYIKLWGREYLISSISWYQSVGYFPEGALAGVTFKDEHGKTVTVHNLGPIDKDNAETGRDSGESLSTNLEKVVIWKQK